MRALLIKPARSATLEASQKRTLKRLPQAATPLAALCAVLWALLCVVMWAPTAAVAQGSATGAAPMSAGTALPTPEQARAELTACLRSLRPEALRHGLGGAAYDELTRNLQPDLPVLAQLENQPEFKTPLWDYLAALVDEERVQDGRAQLAQWQGVLLDVQRRYGVDPATVVAVWGVESNFGRSMGQRPVVASLATLSCWGRRQAYFRGELFSALQIVERGDLPLDALRGSWAGAFGQTQFMPSTYWRLAVDFDGDGRRDLVNSVPDALASTANFLARAGWKSEQVWGFELRPPMALDPRLAGRRNKRPLSDWAARGLLRSTGAPLEAPGLPASTPGGLLWPSVAALAASATPATAAAAVAAAALVTPANPSAVPAAAPATPLAGPVFMVFSNFEALFSYNAAESYALAIAHLADRLRGGAPFSTPWPTDDPGLSRAQRRELQGLLLLRGHAIGAVDGALGPASREAIKLEQLRVGQWPADGRAGQKLLALLRTAAASAPTPPAPLPTVTPAASAPR